MGSHFLISVAPGDSLPIYRQIVEQVKAAVAGGLLAPGDRLPSHRDLAKEIVVAPLTVKRAYDVLENEGFVQTQRGRGTFVATDGIDSSPDANAELETRLRALIRHARALGLTETELARAVRDEWRKRKGART